MQVAQLNVDRSKAREFLSLYREHRAAQTPQDQEIMRVYREIARGRVVIQAFESIRQAGFNAQGYPKLALCRADAPKCFYSGSEAGGTFSIDGWAKASQTRRTLSLRWNDVPVPENVNKRGEAIVPLIPVYLRPKQALSNYYILWEAEWRRVPPVDPMLLVRMAGDMWLVVAAWDLTDVERAVMATQMNG